MAAPDRIRLKDSLRKRPRKGPLLFGAAEDARRARLGPAVLHSHELAEAPAGQNLEALGIAGTIGVVEDQETSRPHSLHRRRQRLHPRHPGGLEEVDDDELEAAGGQRLQGGGQLLHSSQAKVDVVDSELAQPPARLVDPELVVLEGEDARGTAREPRRGASGAELEHRPVRSDPPTQPADRRGDDPGPLRRFATPRSPPGGGVAEPAGERHRLTGGVEAAGPRARIVRPADGRSRVGAAYLGGHLPDWTFFLNARWRRTASRISNGVSRSESFG